MSPSASLEVHPDPAGAGDALAARIIDGIVTARKENRRYLLGCPGGRSAGAVYAALAERVAADRLALDHLVIVMMDDYVITVDGELQAVPDTEPHSCRRFGRLQIVDRLNAGAAAPIPADQLWVPDPNDPDGYEQALRQAGGLDHFILASGSGDGHVAFNPPGSSVHSRTRVIELAEQTRRDNLLTFPTFPDLDAVPRLGISVGIATMIEFSTAATLVVHGAEKRSALRRVLSVEDYDPAWPASVVHACRQGMILTDTDTLEHARNPEHTDTVGGRT